MKLVLNRFESSYVMDRMKSEQQYIYLVDKTMNKGIVYQMMYVYQKAMFSLLRYFPFWYLYILKNFFPL